MLTYATQDEYLAHSEYVQIISMFGQIKPYTNIVLSEETHLSYLHEVYLSYDLEFPTDDSESHVYIPNTLLESAQAGVEAEINNIDMYEKFLEYDLPDNIYNVFYILKEASKSHLKAFENQVSKLS